MLLFHNVCDRLQSVEHSAVPNVHYSRFGIQTGFLAEADSAAFPKCFDSGSLADRVTPATRHQTFSDTGLVAPKIAPESCPAKYPVKWSMGLAP